ncbi:hypothetical protein [Planomicrobium okeanokoites]|uniref:Uncharacterized protein n=1 Tax=Planomicrobium okeanokoites TaxID=244 RepID=A0ABV7KT65_PLAOK|nr:hypothetical protein [Planomicrobium okeanokoites]TAA71598.1 hypothetical protein D2910_04790 [Planomicrobium okeanokoites]
MEYKVIKAFTDLQDNGHVYAAGDSYPRKGTASAERIAALSSTDNKEGVPFIQSVEGDEPAFPEHVGGGYYQLSNGENVKGKKQAVKAEKALTE